MSDEPKSGLRSLGLLTCGATLLVSALLVSACRVVRAPEPQAPAVQSATRSGPERDLIAPPPPGATRTIPQDASQPATTQPAPPLAAIEEVPLTAPTPPDWIIVAGERFSTGTRVVTWHEPQGYDAYKQHCHGEPTRVLPKKPAGGCDTPSRLSEAGRALTPEVIALRGEGAKGPLDLVALRAQVNQFVVHYDVAYTSANCFYILHDVRGLSVHFMLDLDGTIYQTCDLTERARHAGSANDRSVGIEIAHPGPVSSQPKLADSYQRDEEGVFLALPSWLKKGHLAADYRARPARPEPIEGKLHGSVVRQHDFTEAQYEALTHLVAALHRALPGIELDAPRAADGSVLPKALTDAELPAFAGVLGHYHVTRRKIDPGPAFQWDRVLGGARALVNVPAPGSASGGAE